MQKEKGLFIFRKPDLKQPLEEVRSNGAAFIPGMLHEDFRMNLLAEINQGPFKVVREKIRSVHQQFESFGFHADSVPMPWLDTLRAATDRIVRNQEESFRGLRTWRARDVAVQKYDSTGYITSHRDLKRNCGIVVLYTIAGSCTFEILGAGDDDRGGPTLETFHPAAGDMILLRGTCFTDSMRDERPFHRVSGSTGDGPRISAAFRDVAWTGAFHPAFLPQGF